jgi:cytochrome c2
MRGLILLLALCLYGCGGNARHSAAERHRTHQAERLIADHCGACHVIPGIATAKGRVGPSLAGIRGQQVIAGHFANTPAAMTQWIEHPQKLLPGDAMPEMGLSHQEAAAIADYLYAMD